MDVAMVVAQLGGSARWSELRLTVRRRQLRRAVASGTVVRLRRGRYGLPSLLAARTTAEALCATASHLTAALHWGWAVKHEPALPQLTFPRGRKLRPAARTGVERHWRDLGPGDVVDGWVTSRARAVVDCCLDLPFDEALSVADSAWRHGVSPVEVAGAAVALPLRSRRKVVGVLRHADPRAANPFESVLRSLCLQVAELHVTPQHVVAGDGFHARVDLADTELGIVVEAEGFENHGTRAALKRDCRRYTGLAMRGWVVTRFTWDEVMFEAAYVVGALRATAVERRRTASNRGGSA